MSKQTKQLGSWGLIVALVASLLGSVVPFASVVALAGWVVALIGYIKASEELGEPRIRGNIIKMVILSVAAMVIFMLGVMMGGSMMMGGERFVPAGNFGFLMMVVAWLSILGASWFWYKANTLLYEKTNIKLFKTGGLLMFVGAILAIILIGGLISLVGEILLIVAWFNVPEGTA